MEKNFSKIIVKIKKGIFNRELASKIGLSATYLNDIEKEKRIFLKLIL